MSNEGIVPGFHHVTKARLSHIRANYHITASEKIVIKPSVIYAEC
jgi:hypothetical protein